MSRHKIGLSQADLAQQHPMINAIVDALKAAGVVVANVDHNTITTDVDTFTVHRDNDPRGGLTNKRARVCATQTGVNVNFPDGPKMGTTIKKFVGDVRDKRADIDAQDARMATLKTIRNGLGPAWDVLPNHVDCNDKLIGSTCTLHWRLRNVPLDKAADIAAKVAALLAVNGIGQ